MSTTDAYYDYMNPGNWPLSENRVRKLKEREPAKYAEYERLLPLWEAKCRKERDEAYELSNERLKERIDELERRLEAYGLGDVR